MTDPDRIDTYDFALPDDLIATRPAAQRDQSRLLALRPRATEHLVFSDVPALLEPGDLLVMNDARVVPARLHLRRETGGAVEVLLLGLEREADWTPAPPGEPQPLTALTRSSKALRAGERLSSSLPGASFIVLEPIGSAPARLVLEGATLDDLLAHEGRMPLPPYIRRARAERDDQQDLDLDAERYQTVYARQAGAVAAPTAGLHFTQALLDACRARGIETATVTLLVGVGTFRPVSAERLSAHAMHRERYTVPDATARAVREAREQGRRVVAVGTTTVRVLEAAVGDDGHLVAGDGETALLIAPGHRFRNVDAMITNFHLPRSTLLALVCALGGVGRVLDAYVEAVVRRYRFFSYGDAMWLEPPAPGAP
jgi:S-adenosylmethionine:tRNA ribosyltransferase-isomerase